MRTRGELDIKKLARTLERAIMSRRNNLALPNTDLEIGINHLAYMCRCVYNEQVSGNLAHLWLGYVQGVLRCAGGANVSELKEMLKRARDEHGDDDEMTPP